MVKLQAGKGLHKHHFVNGESLVNIYNKKT